LTEAEVGPFARTVPVLSKAILERIGVEAERPPGQILALPGLDRRWRGMGTTGDARGGQRGHHQQAKAT
jgi:hypothetical protein